MPSYRSSLVVNTVHRQNFRFVHSSESLLLFGSIRKSYCSYSVRILTQHYWLKARTYTTGNATPDADHTFARWNPHRILTRRRQIHL